MAALSLSSITYEQGLQLLAARKQAFDSGHIRRMSKEAMATSFYLRDIGTDFLEKMAESGLLDSLKSGFGSLGAMDESTRNVLLAGLTGAGVGAGTSATSALLKGEDGVGWKALTGGLTGGAIGGGLGLAFNPNILSRFVDKKRDGPPASVAPSSQLQAAANIKSRTTTEQLAEIDKLQGVADSSRPETKSYALHGANLAAGGAAGAYIATRSTYDPDALARRLRTEMHLADPKVTSAYQRFDRGMSNTAAATGAMDDAARILLRDRMLNMTHDQFRDAYVPKSLFGRVPSTLAGKLHTAVPALATNILENNTVNRSMFTGLGKIRPGKAGILMALAGLAATGAGTIRHNYNQNNAERSNAQEILKLLSGLNNQ